MKKSQPAGVENGVTTLMETCVAFVGESAMPAEKRGGMSAKGTNLSSRATARHMKHGEEPKEVLLALVWSALETLLARNEARLFVGNGEVAVIFLGTEKAADGLVPTVPQKVLAAGDQSEHQA